LIQTKKISKVPVILVGVEYWSGLKDWIINVMLKKENNINEVDLNLMPITDDVEEVIRIINEFYVEDKLGQLSPNF